jgi:hypothetical protein
VQRVMENLQVDRVRFGAGIATFADTSRLRV